MQNVDRCPVRLNDLAEEHPWQFYARVREEGEIVWDEASHSWLVSSHELCKEISRADEIAWRSVNVPDDHDDFGIARQDWVELVGFGSEHGLTIIEGVEHKEQHRWWMKTFSRAQLRAWKSEYFVPIMSRELEKLRHSGAAELVAQIADIVPRRMVAAVLGLPFDDDALLDRLDVLYATRQAVIYAIRTNVAPSPTVVADAAGHAEELHSTLAPYVSANAPGCVKADAPFLQHLWASAPNLFGPDFDLSDVTNLASAVWEAGTGTTKNGAANLLYLLATRPELLEICLSDDVYAQEGLVEESLRLYGPVVVNSRTALQDVVLGGQEIKRGQRVVMLNNAAGVDDKRFERPFDVDPARSRPRDHFSFGQGLRACPGQHLARVELDAIATSSARLLPGLRLNPGETAPELKGGLLRRWAPLHVTFDLPSSS
jgi:cytochrome P450